MSVKSTSVLSSSRRSDPSSPASRSSSSRSQDSFSDSRRLHPPGSSPLLSTWNGRGSSTSVAGSDNFLLSPPVATPATGGAVSMPSSPRLGRRSYGNQDPSISSRTRKYSTGSLSGLMGGGHSRSLPRLCPSPSPRDSSNGVLTLSTLPPHRSDGAGSYKLSKDHYNNNASPDLQNNSTNSSQQTSRGQRHIRAHGESVVSISLSSPKSASSSTPTVSPTTAPPDVTIPSRPGGSSSPRVAKKLSLTSTSSVSSITATSSPPEVDQLASRGVSPAMEMSFGDRERCGVGQELTPSFGRGERRASFGKAGINPPGGFRERRGSISSLSGKEELTDYHHRQKEERLREQEVERLVSVYHPARISVVRYDGDTG